MDKDSLLALATLVEARSTRLGSELHGPQHWRCVSLVGVRLARDTPGGDPLVAFLFGLFHDAMRANDGPDPGHGRRGAMLARGLVISGAVSIPNDVLELVGTACETHTAVGTTDHPVLAVCYDADCLSLWRKGTKPLPRYLSTDAAIGMIETVRYLHWRPLTWEEALKEL